MTALTGIPLIDMASQRVTESAADLQLAAYEAATVTDALRVSQRIGELVVELQRVQAIALEQSGLLSGRL